MALKEQTSSFEPKPFGRYVLLDKLAIGGMAEIYKAKTYGVDGFEKQLAIKRILPHCAADAEFIRMLVDEAKLTVLLSHANIVQVYDLGKVSNDYFISMEFIYGTNLREMMNRRRENEEKLSEEVAVYIMSEVCKGLDYAHRKTDNQGKPLNIVHRDISPQNILISYEGEIKIVDFGIAKAAMNVSHTMAGILKGKVAYMSPEQALGKPIDHRTDIFSAGVVLYEMLTGEKLFAGETQFEVLNQIRTTRVNTLMLPDDIPGPLKGILSKALAYNIKDRYQTAGDFQLELTKYLYSSYIDFSPRQLSALLHQLFEAEIRRREAPETMDEKTHSALIRQAAQEKAKEEVVVHSTAKVAKKKASSLPEGTISEIRVARTSKPLSPVWWIALGGLLLSILGGYFAYTSLFKNEKKSSTEKSAPTPEESGELGSIRVQSDPPGAKIFLNETDTGLLTPATLPKLNLGQEYQVKMTKENYNVFSKPVTVTSTEPITLTESLQPLPKGIIAVTSAPAGAKVLLNGKETGLVTPARIENLEIDRSYDVRLTSPNYSDWVAVAEVKGFEPVRLMASMTPVPVASPSPAPPPTPLPPPQPQPPRVTYGQVRVSSDPAGAKIFLDGQYTGRQTPATLQKLEAGKRMRVSLTRNGYKDWDRSITVDANKITPLSASLKSVAPPPPIPERPPPPVAAETPEPSPPATQEPEKTTSGEYGTLSIDSKPDGAEVFVNAEYKGTTPIKVPKVPSGSVKVTVSKEGFLRYTTSVALRGGENKSLGTIHLGDLYGEVAVSSIPPRAWVYFDGEKIGARTPVTIRRVPRDRSHSIRVELEGFRPWETTMNLREKDSKRYDIQLEKN